MSLEGNVDFVVGTSTQIVLVSSTHGAVRVPLAQNFDYTPSFDERRLFEFDREEACAIVTNFNGVEISFNHLQSGSKLVDAMVNDLDPAAAVTVDDPANYQDLSLFLNVTDRTSKLIFQSVLIKGTRLNGAAASEPVREEGTIARTGVATNAFRIKGAAIEYARALRSDSVSAFVQGSSNIDTDKSGVVNGGNHEFDLDNEPVAMSANDQDIDGEKIILVLKNGVEFTGTVNITGTKTISIATADWDQEDVFEIFATYLDT